MKYGAFDRMTRAFLKVRPVFTSGRGRYLTSDTPEALMGALRRMFGDPDHWVRDRFEAVPLPTALGDVIDVTDTEPAVN